MSARKSLQLILVVSLMGVSFSGVLTWRELIAGGPAGCTLGGAPGTILGAPACVYGLAMYLILTALALTGLRGVRSEE